MAEYDVVVIGAGHNGLIVAGYLAKAGVSVCVVEKADFVGGAVNTLEVTKPGFKHDTGGTWHGLIQSNPLITNDELGLTSKYGLKYLHPETLMANVFPDDTAIIQYKDVDKTCQSIAQFSEHDADAYRRFYEYSRKFASMLIMGTFSPPPPFGAFVSQLDSSPEGQ